LGCEWGEFGCSRFAVLCLRLWDCWSSSGGVTARCRHSLGVSERGEWARVGRFGDRILANAATGVSLVLGRGCLDKMAWELRSFL
jgi:hypothetical protein